MVRCFVSDDFEFDQKAVEKRLGKPGVKALLMDLVERFSKVGDWTAPALEAVVKELSQGGGMGPWVHPIRVALSGRGEGIGLFEMMQLLGRDKSLARLRYAAERLAAEERLRRRETKPSFRPAPCRMRRGPVGGSLSSSCRGARGTCA